MIRIDSKFPASFLLLRCLGVALALCAGLTMARAQKKEPDRLTKAAQRSENAAKVLDVIMASSDKAIAKDLLDKAEAVAVFPQVGKTTILIDQFLYGQGVVSRRVPGGWGAPTYFIFKGANLELGFGADKTDVVVFFLNEEAINWLLKEKVQLSRKRVGTEPVGKMSDA